MANVPPHTIQVKRKRCADEDPVDFLQIERTKRYRGDAGGWVYQRKQVDVARAGRSVEPSGPATPIIQPTQEGDEKRLLKRLHKPAQAPAPKDATTSTDAPAPSAASKQPAPTVADRPTIDRIRRFHLARSRSPPQPAAGVSKKRTAPAVFVERNAKKPKESLTAIIQQHNVTHSEPSEPHDAPEPSQSPPPADEASAASKEPHPLKLKKPGRRACTQQRGVKPEPPPPMRNRQGTNMDQLAEAMHAFALEEIAKNLEKLEEQSTTSKYSPAKSRFKPKAPKQRYFERHPESQVPRPAETASEEPAAAAPVVDTDAQSSTDEEDYVLETYERVPADRLRGQAVPAHRIGLLVFDNEPDMIEFFYGNEGESEDDFGDDDEDSNAEDYYAADYPDEDLDWDDEFDRNAYHYRNQNASDEEEFDERDFDDLIDDAEAWASAEGGERMSE